MSYTKRSERQKQIISIDPAALKAARQVYRLYLESHPDLHQPKGVVVNRDNMTGKLLYSSPVLLPSEVFVPVETILEMNEYY